MANSKLAPSTKKSLVKKAAVAEAIAKPATARAKAPASVPVKAASKKAVAAVSVVPKAKASAVKSAAAKSVPVNSKKAKPAEAKASVAKGAKSTAKPEIAKATKAKAPAAPAAKKQNPAKAPVAALKAQPMPAPVAAKTPAAPVAAAPAKAPVPAATVRKAPFKANELIVYPAHGVGRVVQIEEQEIAGVKLELYIIDFEKEKLRLKVPTNKADQKGMRRLADKGMVDQAMHTLRGRARIKRTMWSRRAQEYEAKINSGDIVSVAEVVRDLYRSDRQPEQSYSERQLFEQALDRMAREIAAIKRIDDDIAVKEIEDFLSRHGFKKAKALEEDLAAEEEAA